MFQVFINNQHVLTLVPTIELGIRDALKVMQFLDTDTIRLRRVHDGAWFRLNASALVPIKEAPAVLTGLWW
jgi:hypothetical protein